MVKKNIIAIDLGGTNLRIALTDFKLSFKDRIILSTKGFRTKNDLLSAIIDSVNGIIKRNNLSKNDILGIGLGLPGPVDIELGLVHFLPNIPGWKKVYLKKILGQRLRMPVFLDNDANLACLAEYKLGAAKGARNVACLTLGTGVGGGIIIEGRLYRGSTFSGGEIGHIPVNVKGPRCNCRGEACLESYIGNNRILAQAKAAFGRNITLEELSSLANKGEARARGIWHKAGEYLGVALAGVVNLLNPDVIVLGGGVANAGKILFDKAREVVSDRAMTVQARHVKITKAKLGNDAGLIGAALLVKEEMGV